MFLSLTATILCLGLFFATFKCKRFEDVAHMRVLFFSLVVLTAILAPLSVGRAEYANEMGRVWYSACSFMLAALTAICIPWTARHSAAMYAAAFTVCLFFVFTDLLIYGLIPVRDFWTRNPGPLFPIWAISTFVLFSVQIAFLLYRSYFTACKREKNRAKWLFASMVSALIAGAFLAIEMLRAEPRINAQILLPAPIALFALGVYYSLAHRLLAPFHMSAHAEDRAVLLAMQSVVSNPALMQSGAANDILRKLSGTRPDGLVMNHSGRAVVLNGLHHLGWNTVNAKIVNNIVKLCPARRPIAMTFGARAKKHYSLIK